MALSRGLVHTNQSSVQGPSRPEESPCAGATGAQRVRSVQEASCLRQRTRPPDHPAWAWPGPGAHCRAREGGSTWLQMRSRLGERAVFCLSLESVKVGTGSQEVGEACLLSQEPHGEGRSVESGLGSGGGWTIRERLCLHTAQQALQGVRDQGTAGPCAPAPSITGEPRLRGSAGRR